MEWSQTCMPFLIFLFLVLVNEVRSRGNTVFDIRQFGATGDGQSDGSKALEDAFSNACNVVGGRNQILVPEGTFMVTSAVFDGPCKGLIEFRVDGVIKASAGIVDDDKWVAFRYIDGLVITGEGTFDGFGESAWNLNDCKMNSQCKHLPTSIRLDFVKNSVVSGIHSLNSKFFHMKIYKCNNINVNGVHIIAPEDSPNTDGIHIGDSENINILNSVIATGDDCVSMGPGNKNILIQNITCGPGHGISIGSLGKYNNEADISGITVQHCTLSQTMYGLRIKTWASDIQLTAYNITYDDVVMDNANHPILIDQEYCPSTGCDESKPSSVQIKDVWYKNIRGSSKSQSAVNLKCSSKYPCDNINFFNIDLLYQNSDNSVNANCKNVRGSASGIEKPPSCL
ncbi:hypothetical protein SAY86_027480 [Trapa natans]|uniref:Uncharacterized protein n=1 Tax=Trapa natans TaxID=22666 RepID=A0AAN7KT42_TRANT|nr:hypothetical protein SAY86_027480 [Trapa natans]